MRLRLKFAIQGLCRRVKGHTSPFSAPQEKSTPTPGCPLHCNSRVLEGTKIQDGDFTITIPLDKFFSNGSPNIHYKIIFIIFNFFNYYMILCLSISLSSPPPPPPFSLCPKIFKSLNLISSKVHFSHELPATSTGNLQKEFSDPGELRFACCAESQTCFFGNLGFRNLIIRFYEATLVCWKNSGPESPPTINTFVNSDSKPA